MIMEDSKKILLCGYFAFGTNDNGGQPVKSRELYFALCKRYGMENIRLLETKGWKRKPFKLIGNFYKQSLKSDYIIMMPAHNGLNVFSILLYLEKMFGRKKIYYNVIGGWLVEKVRRNCGLKKILSAFDGVWVETKSMADGLADEGFSNVKIVPNFKNLKVLSQKELVLEFKKPYPVCIFSRIVLEKGIEDAIEAVTNINEKHGEVLVTLDLYGQIDNGYLERFEMIRKKFPKYIRYCGMVEPNKSVETLKSYFALLFPTHYYTEGVPGTLIDACAAGVPVITSLWKNHRDVFKQGVTGWGYEFEKRELLQELLERAIEKSNEFSEMRKSALDEAHRYDPDSIINMIDGLL